MGNDYTESSKKNYNISLNTKFKFEDFKIDFKNPLGRGGFGDVYKAIEKKTKKVYAIKRIPIEKLEDEEINNC